MSEGDGSAEESAPDAVVQLLAGQAQKPQVVVRLDVDQDADRAKLHDSGHWLSRDAFERLSCDCALSVVATRNDEVLDVGRTRRTIPPAIQRALLVRDAGCVFPGCGHTRHVEGHHIEHWSRGGETKLDNLCLLCNRQHQLLHEANIHIDRTADGTLVFHASDGTPITTTPTATTHDPAMLLAMLAP